MLFNFQMDLNIREWHRKDCFMVKEEFNMQTETFILENGKREKPTEKVYWLIKMAQCMKVNGLMINIMEKVLNNGTIIKLNILEISWMDKKQEKENLSLMEMFMKETLLTDNSMAKVNIHLLGQEKYMKVILLKTIYKVKEK